MTINRERVGGLGLSVKGGREHNLPVLISRIFKDQAGKTGLVLHREAGAVFLQNLLKFFF